MSDDLAQRAEPYLRLGSYGADLIRELLARLQQAEQQAEGAGINAQKWLAEAAERVKVAEAEVAQIKARTWNDAENIEALRQQVLTTIVERDRHQAEVARLRAAILENVAEIKQQSGVHFIGCTCTFCNVVTRSNAALGDGGPTR